MHYSIPDTHIYYYATQHIIDHFRYELRSQSLVQLKKQVFITNYWAAASKTKCNYSQMTLMTTQKT